jgi:pyrimidine operon attenuation protein/uracil phosphoribosyltransferase
MTDKIDVSGLISNMAREIKANMKHQGVNDYEIVGIHSGGVWVAQELRKALGREQAIGELNISFYRDDFTRVGLHPQVSPSSLPFVVDNTHLILVDDVLMSGRTVRAAMNELFDYGRPASIQFAVLIDLNHRELPIAPSVVGTTMTLAEDERVKLSGPDNLHINIQKIATQVN